MIKTEFGGRLGNLLLQNISISILSEKFDLSVEKYLNLPFELKLHSGKRTLKNTLRVTDHGDDGTMSLTELIKLDQIDFGIEYSGFFQIRNFLETNEQKIIEHFNLVYDEMSDRKVFVHVRLGDVQDLNPGYNYYDFCLSNMDFDSGFISTDTPYHPMITNLIKKYNLTLYQNEPHHTILFAKNFKKLVLSMGSFSWWIGILSKSDQVYWPDGQNGWAPTDIFYKKEWTPVQLDSL